MTVDDLIKLLDTKENRYGGATGKQRELILSVDGRFLGTVDKVKLDGHGDGLVTCVMLEVETSKYNYTNADRIRAMSDEELADLLHNIGSYVEDEEPLIDIYIGESKTTLDDGFGFILEWLQSKAESE